MQSDKSEQTPKELRYFERLWLAALALEVIFDLGFNFQSLLSLRMGPYYLLGGAVGYGLLVALVLLVSRKRYRWAFWVLCVSFVIKQSEWVVSPSALPLGAIITMCMQVAGLFLLFRPDVRSWLDAGHAAVPKPTVEPTVVAGIVSTAEETPIGVRYFEGLWLGALALRAMVDVGFALQHWQRTGNFFLQNTGPVYLVAAAVAFGILLTLVLLVSRKRYRWAFWVLCAAFIFRHLSDLQPLVEPSTGSDGPSSIPLLIEFIVEAVGLSLMLRRDARGWLNAKHPAT